MLEFRPIQLSDRPRYLLRLEQESTQSSSSSFGNVFLWSLLCDRNVAELGERLCMEYLCQSNTPFYTYPIGTGAVRPIVEAMAEHAAAQGRPLLLRAVTTEQKQLLEQELPGCFRFTPDRDNADYLYESQALASLAGKKLHGKRNHCNRFEASYDWHCETLTPALFDDCRAVLRRWEDEKDGGSADENLAIDSAFRSWDELGMTGCVLYANGESVAFSFGEFLRPDTFDVHFEKAPEDMPGAFPMICRELVRQLRSAHPQLNYVNREEDMGLPGLRKAKEEWYPVAMVEKFTAEWVAEV